MNKMMNKPVKNLTVAEVRLLLDFVKKGKLAATPAKSAKSA
jgi:hypothetical protein